MAEKKRRARPFEVAPQTIVKIGNCAECGGRVQVKINAAQKAYYNCPHADDMGNPCGYQVRVGAAKSEAIRRAYVEKRDGVKPTVTANINAAPKPNVTKRDETAANTDAAPEKKGDEYDEYFGD